MWFCSNPKKKKKLGGQQEIRRSMRKLGGFTLINAWLHRFGHNRRSQPQNSA